MPEISDPQKLLQPREHNAKVCIWGDLTVADVDAICDAGSPEDKKSILANLFGLYQGDSPESAMMKDEVLLDLYFYTIQFCIDNNFSKEQLSAFFSIIKRTHTICVETPFGNVEEAFKYFRDMILCHAVKRPPFSIDLYSPDQVRLLTDYAVNTYFRHYKMYKYVFTPLVKLDLGINYEGIPVPSPPPEEEVEPEPEIAEPVEEIEPEKPNTPDGENTKPDSICQNVMGNGDPSIEIELSPAQQELRALIQKQLEEEVGKLRVSMEEQMKVSDDGIQKKLAVAEGGSGRGSSKAGGRKKK